MNYVLKDLTLHAMQVSLSRGMVHFVSSAKERLASDVSSASSTCATVVGLCGIQIQNNFLGSSQPNASLLRYPQSRLMGKNRNKKHKVGKR
jgi:hypothetical protein